MIDRRFVQHLALRPQVVGLKWLLNWQKAAGLFIKGLAWYAKPGPIAWVQYLGSIPEPNQTPARPMSDPALASELITVRDFLRFAVSRFEEAQLSYGHGTDRALDEAAFLILTTLHLPIDSLEPWLDARLTRAERAKVLDVIEARVVTRKPAAYIVKSAWIGPHQFYVDERVIVPRSYLGEMLNEGLAQRLDMDLAPRRILDLCTGSGCLAVLAALEFPDAEVVAVDLSSAALQVAAINIERYGLKGRVRLVESDLFAALKGETFDLILTNPPYVTEAAVAAFPPEYKAEPVMAHDGGADGMDLVRTIIALAGQHLTADGVMVAEVGTGRETLEADFIGLPFLWLDSEGSEAEVFALTAGDLVQPAPKKRGVVTIKQRKK